MIKAGLKLSQSAIDGNPFSPSICGRFLVVQLVKLSTANARRRFVSKRCGARKVTSALDLATCRCAGAPLD
jgi:hypothetical protein